uniref:Uncharacterized protein n=1 Tax=Ursus americanus TaxID=9643 RepID=A0A452QH60_URSAM
MDEVCVKEEKYFPKEEVMDGDTKVKEEPQINPPVGFKRKLAIMKVPPHLSLQFALCKETQSRTDL